MKCPKCGTELARGEKTCWQCYAPVEAAGEGQQVTVKHARAGRSAQPRSRVLSLLPVIVVLAAGGGGYYWWSQHTGPAACARAYCSAMEEKDGNALRAVLSSGSQEYADWMMPLPGMDMNIQLEVASVTRSGDSATARIRQSFKMGKGPDATETITTSPLMLVKEPGGWRVDMQETAEAQMQSMRESMKDLGFDPAQKLDQDHLPKDFGPEDFKREP